MKLRWRPGNQLRLLENGEAYYPEVLDAIGRARREVLVETFILYDDVVGRRLRAALLAAAQRGVRVDLTVDDYGSPDLSPEFIDPLVAAGVRLHVFDPQPRLLGLVRLNLIQRLHRKIVAVDGDVAFIGGINFSEDHLIASGPMAKQDYAVCIRGPLAQDIRHDALLTIAPARQRLRWLLGRPASPAPQPIAMQDAPAGDTVAAFVKRDNGLHRDDIERCYRLAIRAARDEVLIANAYFFPGFRLLRELRRAARRGVRVELILQGEPDVAYVRTAARLLYQSLAKDGVLIHEYRQRPLHGKVAVVDGEWVTVGSSNLDPLSLALNLEANVVARDRGLADDLRSRLVRLREQHCRTITQRELPRFTMWRYLLGALTFHVVRGFPAWLRHLPRPRVKLRTFAQPVGVIETEVEVAAGATPLPGPEGAR